MTHYRSQAAALPEASISAELLSGKSVHARLKTAASAVTGFIRKNTVFCVAVIAAVITSFFVKPDAKYAEYIDYKTITCLFCVLAVVCALQNIDFFVICARKIVERFKTARKCVIALVYITFIGSMFIANDMALLTFLPLGYYVLHTSGREEYMAFTFIMQNIAANLGGMLTPFGNPQNLYLYSRFNIPNGEFMLTMLPVFLFSVTLITLCCFAVRNEPVKLDEVKSTPLNPGRTALYLALFALSIAIVFRQIPYVIGLIVIPAVLVFADRKALRQVDYGLLFTFVAFFIFAGNMSRIEPVRELLGGLLEKNTLLVSTLSCQVISNVPSAILLSQFVGDYHELLIGVNIGGVGTLISSLASLITFREYTARNPGKTLRYIGLYSLINFSFLAVLLIFCTIIL